MGAREVSPTHLVREERSTPLAVPSGTAILPAEMIGDDARFVLFRYPSGLIANRQRFTVGDDGRAEVEIPLPAHEAGASPPLIVAKARAGDVWHDLPLARIAPEVQGDRSVVRFRASLPSETSGRTAHLFAQALQPADGGRSRVRTEPLDVPEGAVLEVAVGIAEAARGQGAVRFSLSACVAEDCQPILSEVVDDVSGSARWRELSASLAGFAGSRVELLFETELADDPTGARYSLPLWGNPTVFVPAAAPPARPNVVLISIDTLRADHLGAYGYRRGTSPRFDALAKGGTLFEGLVSEAATTDPSHMTMFTSVPAAVHGVTGGMKSLAVPVLLLAEALRAQGYVTAAFTEDGPLARARGFGRGFEEYAENRSPVMIAPDGHVKQTFAQGRHWMERNRGRSFFLFLHTFQVHGPYTPPPKYRERIARDGRRWVRLGPAEEKWRAKAERNAANYDAEILFTDHELGVLVDWMEAEGLFANTVLIVLSDHGEEFFEHGQLGHGTLPWEQVLRPPLLVYGAGVAAGRRVTSPVAHLDLMPTVLELTGVAGPAQMQGQSFAREVREDSAPGPSSDAARRLLFSSTWVLPKGLDLPAEAVRRGSEKLIRFRGADGPHRLCFDLATDPDERRDLCAERPELANELSTRLDERAGQMSELRDSLTGKAPPESPAIPLDPVQEEKLRALGYID